MDAVFAEAKWKKSTKSGLGNCVEVARAAGVDLIGVRDSKNPDGPILKFRPAAWNGFLDAVKAENFSV